MPALLSKRERAVWAACFVAMAALIVAARFESRDPDSALYAAMSARLAELPVSHWIAPYWFGLWHGSGVDQLFLENPAGIFVIPVALDRVGIPAAQGAYVVGIAAGLGSLLLIAALVSRVTSRDDGRAVLLLLQLMPVAFIFRVRSNHEYPMLFCLAVCLIGLEGLSRSWRSAGLVIAGLVGAVVIKGVFVVPILIAAALWVAIDPPASGSRSRQAGAVLAGLAAIAAAVVAYDAAFYRVTGSTFWGPYWRRQLDPVTIATPFDGAATMVSHLSYYVVRILWHPAPWSLALIWIGWRRASMPAAGRAPLAESQRRGLWFALAFVTVSVVMFSLPSRFAERYLFSATYAFGTCGAVVAWRAWPRLRAAVSRLDAAIPALPAVLWTVLMVLRIGLGPWIPRIQDH
jgi:4-amino-4-deoxy-L-arabinose transferase-like glycosyltransferase